MYDNGIIVCNMGNRTKFIKYKYKAGLYTKICIAHLYRINRYRRGKVCLIWRMKTIIADANCVSTEYLKWQYDQKK